jgi:CRP/FNR family transcriptional regulator, cyclic AMP receptor protein
MSLRWPLLRRGKPPASGISGRAEKLWYLRQIRLFDRLTEPDLQRLAQSSQMREYARGEVIQYSKPPADVIQFVKMGRVKISTFSPDGKEQVLALLDPGDLFGELAPAQLPAPVRAEAFDRAIVCSIERTLFEEIVRNTPDVALKVIHALARRLRAAEQEIEDLALRDVPARLASLLLRLAEGYGEEHERGVRLSFRLTHQDLAHMIGSTRETVTMTMNRFRDDGLISVDRRTLIILDRERLGGVARLPHA